MGYLHDQLELDFESWLDDCVKTARQRGLKEDEIIERMCGVLYQLCLAKLINKYTNGKMGEDSKSCQ